MTPPRAKTAAQPCRACGHNTVFTAEISIVLVDSALLQAPFPLIPTGGYRLCMGAGCASLVAFVDRAVKAHEEAMTIGDTWSKAIIVFKDLTIAQVTPNRPSTGNLGVC